MESKKLVHIIYSSTAAYHFSSSELLDLLTQARTKNHIMNITGILLYIKRDFFQILEGNSEQVNILFNTIMKDKRHHNIIKIIEESIPNRTFDEWNMGFADVTVEQLRTIEGLSNFFNDANCLKNLNAGRSKKLLQAFSKGYWRQKIT